MQTQTIEPQIWAPSRQGIVRPDQQEVLELGIGTGTGITVRLSEETVAAGGSSLLSFINPVGVMQCLDARASDVTKDSSNRVSEWRDGHTTAEHMVQTGADSIKPVWGGAYAPEGNPAIIGDGANDYLINTTLLLPDPNPSICAIYGFVCWYSWTANDTMFASPGTFNATCALLQSGGSPGAVPYTGAIDPGAATMTLGTWYRIYIEYHGIHGSDMFDVGGALQVADNYGTNAPTAGRALFARPTPSNYAHAGIAEMCTLNRVLTAGELSASDGYITSKYGGLIVEGRGFSMGFSSGFN